MTYDYHLPIHISIIRLSFFKPLNARFFSYLDKIKLETKHDSIALFKVILQNIFSNNYCVRKFKISKKKGA